MRLNSSDADAASHLKRTATRARARAITTPMATSWAIPLRTAAESTPSRDRPARRGVELSPAKVAAVKGPAVALLAAATFALLGGANDDTSRAAETAATPSGRPVVLAFAGDVHFEGDVRAAL